MARIVKKQNGEWTEIASGGIATYAQQGETRFTIEAGTHRLELSADEAADLFARAFDHSVQMGHGHLHDVIAAAKSKAHKEPA